MHAGAPPDSQSHFTAEDAAALRERLSRVSAAVADAARRVGQETRSVSHETRLVAVSKRHGVEAIAAALAAGQRDFGENYAQELADKRDDPRTQGARWHFIGALQSNKAATVASPDVLIHSVDRVSVARARAKAARAGGFVQPVLVQVNLDREPQKGGCLPEQLDALIEEIGAHADALRCDGLMLIPAASLEHDALSGRFAQLATLRDQVAARRLPHAPCRELSMGMSDDFELAIAHGATLVRVGTAIFGARSGTQPT